MITNEELASKEALIKFYERQTRVLRETLLDHFAQAAVASGRCAPSESYKWAEEAMKAREACTAASTI